VQNAEQIYRTYRFLLQEGKTRQAQEMLTSNTHNLQTRQMLGALRQQLGELKKQMNAVYNNRSLSAIQKRKKLDQLQYLSN